MKYHNCTCIDILGEYPTGSQVIGGATETSDHDWVIWVDSIPDATAALSEDGWEINLDDPAYQAHENGEVPFATARKGDINLIIYSDRLGFVLWQVATDLAVQLELDDKDARRALFKLVLDNRA